MDKLTRNDESGPKWYPIPIDQLDAFLIKVIARGHRDPDPYALRKNLCYNLQYLEYLDTTLKQVRLSDVLITLTWKTFIVTGCGILESLLKFLLIRHGEHSTKEWELERVFPGAEKSVDGERKKVDSHVYRKLSSPVLAQMTFDGLLGRARAKKMFGPNSDIYDKLEKLRKLRNRVHLQRIEHGTDTDWNAFQKQDYLDMRAVLYAVFTSTIFRPNHEERGYFEYLRDGA